MKNTNSIITNEILRRSNTANKINLINNKLYELVYGNIQLHPEETSFYLEMYRSLTKCPEESFYINEMDSNLIKKPKNYLSSFKKVEENFNNKKFNLCIDRVHGGN
jgi:hypothetical protein